MQQGKKKPIQIIIANWTIFIFVMLVSILISFMLNWMSWTGSYAFIKAYMKNYSILASVTFMILPSVMICVTLYGLIKIYSALKYLTKNNSI